MMHKMGLGESRITELATVKSKLKSSAHWLKQRYRLAFVILGLLLGGLAILRISLSVGRRPGEVSEPWLSLTQLDPTVAQNWRQMRDGHAWDHFDQVDQSLISVDSLQEKHLAARCADSPVPKIYSCSGAPRAQIGIEDMFNHSCTSYEARYGQYRPLLELDDWSFLKRNCKTAKSVVILRLWDGHQFTEDAMLNIAAMIVELSNDHDIALLYEVPQEYAIYTSEVAQKIQYSRIPKALHPYVTFFNEPYLRAMYTNDAPDLDGNPVNGRYRGCFMPVQLFGAEKGWKYDFYVNWEADMRYMGDYAELFGSSMQYARTHASNEDGRYHIPMRHGVLPDDNSNTEPDFVTWSPMIQVRNSLWYFRNDLVGFGEKLDNVPRRTAIIATSIISRRLLEAMHGLNAGDYGPKKNMFCEMFAASVAMYGHNYTAELPQMKAVYVPHPVYMRHRWPPGFLDYTINADDFHVNEDRLKESTWGWNGVYSRDLYKEWKSDGSFRASALLHPVKWM